MTRLFIERISASKGIIILDRENSHYVRNVLRFSRGDKLTVFNGTGREYVCTVFSLTENVTLSIADVVESHIKPLKEIILLQGLLKGRKMDIVVRKATEIGVGSIVPVVTERSRIRSTSKVLRWRKIAMEASRQCRRTDVPNVSHPIDADDLFTDFLSRYPDALKVVFYENGKTPVGDFRKQIREAKTVIILVGPEGGLSDGEVETLAGAGFKVAGLGDFILRAETASLISAGIIQYISGQFG
ncbi:MAG TPA: 16S rRNA (uracil(1498)-N(3))-methyltransferase [Nitrospirae bacterium]|nr:16S rRNA (uracil(1498)-N(3))-methyltransferase [Nitrospirota bacterium]